jgi:prepilin signal peptidase PulO-like enzyme (type II secretory pathway)
MRVTSLLAFKIFVSATAIAGLLDMYIVQLIRNVGGLSASLINKNLYWARVLPFVRSIIGETTISYLKTRTLLFPALELLFGVLVIVSLYTHGVSVSFIRMVLFLMIALPLAISDQLFMIVPNRINYPGAVIGILTSLFLGLNGPANSVFAGIILGGTLWLMGWIWERFRGIEAMGRGTVKTGFMIGTFCNWKLAVLTLFLGALAGSIYGIIDMLRSRRFDRTKLVPFDVHLLASGVVSMVWGTTIVSWYAAQFKR